MTAPATLPATRLSFERHIYKLIAAVTLVRPELDSDLHLVLRVGNDHMIAEAPDLHRTRDADPTAADGCRSSRRPPLPARLGHWRCVVRLRPRPDRCRPERNPAPPDPGVSLPRVAPTAAPIWPLAPLSASVRRSRTRFGTARRPAVHRLGAFSKLRPPRIEIAAPHAIDLPLVRNAAREATPRVTVCQWRLNQKQVLHAARPRPDHT